MTFPTYFTVVLDEDVLRPPPLFFSLIFPEVPQKKLGKKVFGSALETVYKQRGKVEKIQTFI